MKQMHVRLAAGRLASVVALTATAVLAGCATGGYRVGPEDIPRLEREAAASPGNEVRTQLGVAYYNAERYEDARTALRPVVDAPPGSGRGTAFLYTGLANEAMEDWTAARAAYDQYLEEGQSDEIKEALRSRLAIVARNELRQQARLAMENEEAISAEPPTPRTVAVFPFRIAGGREELKPLEVALADMITTDLQLSQSLRLLERSQVQALLNEMVLSGAGYTTPETGARAGRLLRAEHIVQGVLTPMDENAIRLDAAIVAAQEAAPRAELSGDGVLDAIFDVEKRLVFDVLAALDVQLTDAEREAINENRAGNLLSLLAYGRGLEAMDRGDYAGAVSEFQQATMLDPSFNRAQEQSVEAVQLETASNVSTQDVAQQASDIGAATPDLGLELRTESLLKQTANETVTTPAVTYTQSTTQTTNTTTTQTTTQSAQNRNASQEGQGSDGVTQATRATITITIPRPRTGT